MNAVNGLRPPPTARLCHSSRRAGVMDSRAVSAWIQYSLRTPPSAGSSCGTAWDATAPPGRRTRAAAASGFLNDRGPSTDTCSPPIVHSSATPPAAPKNERRVVDDPDPMTRPESSTDVLPAQVRTYWLLSSAVPTRAEASQRVHDEIVAATV